MKKRVFSDNEIKRVLDLYKKGESMELISKELKTSRPTIKKILKDNNVPLNKKGGQKKHFVKEIDYSIYENKVLKCKKTNKIIKDVLNRSGYVLIHLKEVYNIEPPVYFTIDDIIGKQMYYRKNNIENKVLTDLNRGDVELGDIRWDKGWVVHLQSKFCIFLK